MAAAGNLRYAYLAWMSKPREDRRLYRLVKKLRVKSLVELGVDSLERSLRLVSVCQRFSPGESIRYTALDWFEERPAEMTALSLIDAHRQLKLAGAESRLMPGGPAEALPAVANSLLGTDLVLISPEVSDESLAASWYYVPRILKDDSVVLRGLAGVDGAVGWSELDLQEIDARADAAQPRLAA